MVWNGETESQYRARERDGIIWFALFPAQMHDGQWVWLEWFWSSWVPTHSGRGYWRNGRTQYDAMYRGPLSPPPPKPKR